MKLSILVTACGTLFTFYLIFKGGITGKIYGSPNFDDGEQIETSPIVSGSVQNGSVVRTGSGSRYFLSADTQIKSANKAAAIKDIQSARPGATITLTREKKELEAKADEVKPRATFSLLDLTGGKPQQNAPIKPTPPTITNLEKAPRGVPIIKKWRKNFDGSITGFISGSPNFADGAKITTSPISGGPIASGQVVKTGRGSRYFLA